MERLTNDNFYIFACFTRSFDESHIKSGRVNLISSVVVSRFNLNYNDIVKNFEPLSSIDNKNYYIFNIVENDDNLLKNSINGILENRWKGLTVITTSLERLTSSLMFSDKENEMFENIFGGKDSSKKDLNAIYSHSLFIFRNVYWSNIVLKFKLNGVDLNGGSSPKRHLLNTADAELKDFLNIIYNFDHTIINKDIIYNSFKNEVNLLSSRIPLNYYTEYIEKTNLKLENLSFNDDDNVNDKNKVLSILNELPELDKGTNVNKYDINDFILRNIFLTASLLKESIIKDRYLDKIESLKRRLNKNKMWLDLEEESLKRMLNIDDKSTSMMSNKDKKKFKKERSKLKANRSIVLKAQRDFELNSKKLEKLENDIFSMENECEEMIKSLKNKHLIELNEIYSNNKKKININLGEKKKFSKYLKPTENKGSR